MDEIPTLREYLQSDCLLMEDYIRSKVGNRYYVDYDTINDPQAIVIVVDSQTDSTVFQFDLTVHAYTAMSDLNRQYKDYFVELFTTYAKLR